MRDCRRRTPNDAKQEIDEINHGREQIHLDQPAVALRDLAGRAEEIR